MSMLAWPPRIPFVDRQFVDASTAGSVIRGGTGSVCLCTVIGLPFTSVSLSGGGNVSLGLTILICAMPFCFVYGVWTKKDDHLRPSALWAFVHYSSCCRCGLMCFLMITILSHALLLPSLIEEYRVCCNDCIDYCNELSSSETVLCQDDIGKRLEARGLPNSSSVCGAFPALEPRVADCALRYGFGFEMRDSNGTGTLLLPTCAENGGRCIFPAWCNPSTPSCYATAQMNAQLRAPGGSNFNFSTGPCMLLENAKSSTAQEAFAIMYVIAVFGIIGAWISVRESSYLYGCNHALMNADVQLPSLALFQASGIAAGQPIQPSGSPSEVVVVGKPVTTHPGAGPENNESASGEVVGSVAAGSRPPELAAPEPAIPAVVLTEPGSSGDRRAASERRKWLLMGVCCCNIVLVALAASLLLPSLLGIPLQF